MEYQHFRLKKKQAAIIRECEQQINQAKQQINEFCVKIGAESPDQFYFAYLSGIWQPTGVVFKKDPDEGKPRHKKMWKRLNGTEDGFAPSSHNDEAKKLFKELSVPIGETLMRLVGYDGCTPHYIPDNGLVTVSPTITFNPSDPITPIYFSLPKIFFKYEDQPMHSKRVSDIELDTFRANIRKK